MLKLDWPAAEKRAASSFRPLPDREPTNPDIARYAAAVFVLAAILAVLLAAFFIGRATLTDDVASATESAARAEVLAGAATDEAAEWERRYVSLEASVAALASEVTSATEAAELWQQRAEDASATAAAVGEDNEALERDIARIQQQKREAPATSSATQASTTASAAGWQTAKVSWYGPGFYGRKTASGAVLTAGMMNVAHKTLAFGTRIEFRYKGRTVTAVVNDRGPFIAGRMFDLGPGTAKALGFSGVGTVEWRVI
jgi:hypothetical protein